MHKIDEVLGLKESSVDKFSLSFFYRFGGHLNRIAEMTAEPSNRQLIKYRASFVKDYISDVLVWSAGLQVCQNSGNKLMTAVENMEKWASKATPEQLAQEEGEANLLFGEVVSKAKEFETVLAAELYNLPTYVVTKKGIYTIDGLLDNTEDMFPEPVRTKLNADVIVEIRQSGMCLAFDIPTACGFHILRATELVLHEYYVNCCKPGKLDKLPNWGAYITELKKSTDSDVKETIAILQQIKDNDRNLIMHPERVLSYDDAFRLFEIAKGAIIAMSSKLPMPKTRRAIPLKPSKAH
jgi:hypothetical protein